MKLLMCRQCYDIIGLSLNERKCECGATKGHYLEDGRNAVYSGPALPIGIDNIDLRFKGDAWLEDSLLEPRVNCWIFRKDYERMRKE